METLVNLFDWFEPQPMTDSVSLNGKSQVIDTKIADILAEKKKRPI